ncbi:adenosine deaminase [Basilea psittacipulmonis]|uniref:Adenine deaminase n=1 Tax=Basilea psittacipulmonis DSM 24701 TaxID=1072685 RepID=A0A077DFW8_9BURK|nr:adenosine deaminase [Basilea psittacipulmonis]AIL33066.1 adenine deaminase [Basilea psittacipulmonis DSM 24701]
MTIEQYIDALPKAELHLHIEGTFEPELMFEMAQRNQVSIPYASVEEVKQAYQFHNLQSFLDIYYAGASVLLHEQDFYDLAMAYFQRCYEDNVVHTEIFFDPQTHTHRGVSFGVVINGLSKACQDAKKQYGISSELIMCFLRHLPQDDAIKTLEQAKPFLSLIKGVGLDSSELGFPPELFSDVFQQAKELGLMRVAHAGEEGPASYVWGALDALDVSRIDHGVRSQEDDVLMQRLVDEQIPLTVCPLSNLALKVVNHLKHHNLKKMLDKGVCVTINSDDPAYFGGYMNANFYQITHALNLSKDDVKQLCLNSFKASSLSQEEKTYWYERIEAVSQHD